MEDVPEKQKLLDSIDKKIECMKSMTEIIDPLYREIGKQKKKRQISYLKILDQVWKIHVAKCCNQLYDDNLAEALTEAENHIRADRKCIAFKEIDEQCQKIENNVSFGPGLGSTNLPCLDRAAVASLIYASEYWNENDKLVQPLKRAKTMFSKWYDPVDYIVLERESVELRHSVAAKIAEYVGDGKPRQTKEKEKLETEKLEKDKLRKVRDIARNNNMRRP